jgi:hypothetical protein
MLPLTWVTIFVPGPALRLLTSVPGGSSMMSTCPRFSAATRADGSLIEARRRTSAFGMPERQ